MSLCQRAQRRARGMVRCTVRASSLPSGLASALHTPRSLNDDRWTLATAPFSTHTNARVHSPKERQRAERDHLIKSLKESPGKRDARNFLKHFDAPRQPQPQPQSAASSSTEHAARQTMERAYHDEWRLTRTGVNLGNLYEPTKAVQDNPVFAQGDHLNKRPPDRGEPLHLALVKLREPQALDHDTLRGIALTLSQMTRLGLNIALVVDCDEHVTPDLPQLHHAWDDTVRVQLARIVAALEEFNEPGAFTVDHALTLANTSTEQIARSHGEVQVKNPRLLFSPLEDGIILVIPPWAYDTEFKKVRVQPDQALLALTRTFTGLPHGSSGQGMSSLQEPQSSPSRPAKSLILDRVILLDPLGGIPSERRSDGAHVFLNLEAEYGDVRKDLEQWAMASVTPVPSTTHRPLGDSSPFSQSLNSEIMPSFRANKPRLGTDNTRHTSNLDVIQAALRLLPPSSSALIITPSEAAISSQVTQMPSPSPGVRTRRSKNPLIHNLLTDKPMISSSLPAPLVTRHVAAAAPNPATFLKKGIPVTLIPDPRTEPWQPPTPHRPSIELESDPRINFPRLVELINDSFRRELDTRHYLDRIRGQVAGIIIAGDYEGGAICTWEAPPGLGTSPPDDSPLWVPYLDKFAVLTSSQGSGGVADIVWGALTRTCFPNGLVWRSRTSNPVNKWYFERAVGMLNLPGGQWTMFWTTDGVAEEWARKQSLRRNKGPDYDWNELTRWDAYVSVCSGVVPSWADGKKPD